MSARCRLPMPGSEVDPSTSTFEAVVVAGGARVGGLMQRAERELERAADGYGEVISGHALATLAAGGKRLRPLLVFLCGTPSDSEDLVRAAAAIELVHMATLVHDDVIDAAPLRRGSPTVFATAGRIPATATGDFLFSRSLALLAGNGSAEQTRVLADACLALSQGEFAQREDSYSIDVSLDRYLMRCDLKTARLFAAACTLGAMAAGRPVEQVELLRAYGERIGVAFQMLDDVLDVSGPTERIGKQRGTDLLDGTTTLPLILAREKDPFLRDFDLRELNGDADRAGLVCDRIAATGSLVGARRRALELVAEAKQSVEGRIDAELADALNLVADGVVDRYS